MIPLDIRQLQTFSTVADLLNFTRAAQVLGYAQSSVTAQIRSLEEEIGQDLFERQGRRVALTEAGRRFRPYASRILATADEAAQVTRGTSAFHDTLRIGTAETLCVFRLPAVLRQYRSRYPGVNLQIQAGGCQAVRGDLRAGRLDVALILDEPHDEPDLIAHPLVLEPISVLTYPWHPLAAAKQVVPADLMDQSLIHTEAESTYRIRFDQGLAKEGVRPGSVMEFNSIEAIKQCVMAGLGIAVLPRISCATEFEQGSLVELPWAGPQIQIVTQVVHHQDKWLSPSLTAFLDLLHQVLAR